MKKRVIIVDFNHLVYSYYNSNFRLTKTVNINGVPQMIDTTIQSGTIKNIHRWSNGGSNPTAVCFDSPVPSRKAYFAKTFGVEVDGDTAYKGRRVPMSGEMFEAIEMTKNLLIESGVSCFKGNNYEADDLVFACVCKAKEDYPNLPIDVITNDADLLPLVDEQVSVFLRSKKFTWAESPELEKPHYIQVTPRNYQEVVEGLSTYKKFNVPYNTLLLHKLLRGDSSDNISASIKKLFPPRKYNELIETLESNNVDFSKIFNYGKCIETLVSIKTGEVVDLSHDKNDIAVRYDDPKELTEMINTLCWYIEDDEVLEHIKKLYRGINLNQAYVGLGNISRRPARLRDTIKSFNEMQLQSKIAPLGINLKLKLY